MRDVCQRSQVGRRCTMELPASRPASRQASRDVIARANEQVRRQDQEMRAQGTARHVTSTCLPTSDTRRRGERGFECSIRGIVSLCPFFRVLQQTSRVPGGST